MNLVRAHSGTRDAVYGSFASDAGLSLRSRPISGRTTAPFAPAAGRPTVDTRQPGQLRVVTRASGAENLEPLVQHMLNLIEQTKVHGWDCEGGAAIPLREWMRALRFADRVARHATTVPPPFPSPCGDGTTHLRWTRRPGQWLEVEQRDGVYAATIMGDDRPEVREDLGEDAALDLVVAFLGG